MPSSSGDPRPRIAVFAGPTATVLSSPPLVTSQKARQAYDLEVGDARRYDALRPQRLAAPVTVYVERFSAHPLEAQVADLYAPPDGYVDVDGVFSTERRSDDDVEVYAVTLEPDDGLYPLPYAGRRADGSAWDGDAADPRSPGDGYRQAFYPDSARLFEELDRLVVGADGRAGCLAAKADFTHLRPAPSGGYPAPPDGELIGVDYFPYRPAPLRREPVAAVLAHITNQVQAALVEGHDGGLWLEGSPFVEETAYWLNLLLDTTAPVACCAGNIETGRTNVVDAVTYVTSGVWSDANGRDALGVVCVLDEQIFTAREVQKSDDRPGGFSATGGHGGIVGTIGKPGPPVVTFTPNRAHTWNSEVRITRLPRTTRGLTRTPSGAIESIEVPVTDEAGALLPDAVPAVRIIKHARYVQRFPDDDDTVDVELFGRLHRDLAHSALVGTVLEAGTPYGDGTAPLESGLQRAIYSGVPVVKVGRGDVGGFVPAERVPLGIAGGNLTATKARLLLMACLLRFGALPPARNPGSPTAQEQDATRAHLALMQDIFDTH